MGIYSEQLILFYEFSIFAPLSGLYWSLIYCHSVNCVPICSYLSIAGNSTIPRRIWNPCNICSPHVLPSVHAGYSGPFLPPMTSLGMLNEVAECFINFKVISWIFRSVIVKVLLDFIHLLAPRPEVQEFKPDCVQWIFQNANLLRAHFPLGAVNCGPRWKILSLEKIGLWPNFIKAFKSW